ncbi:MAG: hypothetical protein QGI60_03630 [archaeon]|jgi:hypothetical protein|nr:hypothetical protein [archaeon]
MPPKRRPIKRGETFNSNVHIDRRKEDRTDGDRRKEDIGEQIPGEPGGRPHRLFSKLELAKVDVKKVKPRDLVKFTPGKVLVIKERRIEDNRSHTRPHQPRPDVSIGRTEPGTLSPTGRRRELVGSGTGSESSTGLWQKQKGRSKRNKK